MNAYIEFADLAKVYPTVDGPVAVVKDFDLQIKQGEFVSIIGHSGCGKSTVLSMIAGLNEISDGAIYIDGRRVTGPGPDRGVVFQSPSLFPWMTAMENVLLGVEQVFPHGSKRERREIAEYYLNRVGLVDALDKRAAELSQGMRQRVGIARAFALKPKLLLLDEPFGMLDSLTRTELQDVLLEVWRRDRITAIMVTHDVDEALFLSDRVVMMTSGPQAKVGDVLPVEFPRPRDRRTVCEHEHFYDLRGHLLRFLDGPALVEPGAALDEERETLDETAPKQVA
ncbi:MAG: ABC transporter ATP-binding protein [Gemmatimonadota bacterium]|nr:ABC transporter ATP-binding protein [Gemmatimonadota bacterium]